MNKVYFDYAAATPLDEQVLKAMEPYFSAQFYNPSALYLDAKTVSKSLNTARASVAELLGARAGEIIFTAGGTEANNLAIHGIMQQYPDAKILVSAIEHESVLNPAHQYDSTEIPVDEQGIIDLRRLEKMIDDSTVLVSVMYANNEIGTIEPLKDVADLIKKLKTTRQVKGNYLPLLLHTDACQAANYLYLNVARLGVDMMTLNGGKIYGPKQSGALYINSHVNLSPQILGGGQEMGKRSGTENVAGIVGFAKALEIAQASRHSEAKRLKELQMNFFKQLQSAIPNIQINGSTKHRLPNNVHITIPGKDNERLIMALDENGIQAAAGSACSASHEEPSHVLRAIGLSEAEAQSSLRFTSGRSTTKTDLLKTSQVLAKIIA